MNSEVGIGTQRLRELLGAYTIKATADANIRTQMLCIKVRRTVEFSEGEKAFILRALNFCIAGNDEELKKHKER